MRLPAALAPWSDSLAFLAPDLAVALGPLVRGIDHLVSGHDRPGVEQGSTDGFEGLSRRGHPELMLVSEWLLADEAPVEFLRRAAQRELLHLAPAVRRPRRRGRVAVLADTGPGQAGAGRLVQLASMLVLHRRAAALGTDLAVGVLGQEPGSWRTGDLSALLRDWLRARRTTEPDADDVSAWTDADDDVWVLTGPRLAARLTGRRQVISSRESQWGAEGVTHVRVAFRDSSAELALPTGPVAVRALRGQGLTRAATPEEPAATFRFPFFPSSSRRILARGGAADELVSIYVPPSRGASVRKPVLHRLTGPVLAASVLGRRLIAMIVRDGTIRIEVIGSSLGNVADLRVPVETLALDPDAICSAGLLPLYYLGGDVICPSGGDWWRLTTDGTALKTNYLALTPRSGSQFDQPQFITRPADPKAEIILGDGGHARSTDGSRWQTFDPHGTESTVTVEPNSKVLRLMFDGMGPTLVTCSKAGVLVRLVRPWETRVLTTWSGLPTTPIVHPTLPLIAGVDANGGLLAGHLFTGDIMLRTAVGE
ncbi:hypothetical protein Aph01nite_05750 [Acrocarpospora phusangensis]|uniref:Uncharacterized protein n=1 Tax=Acrocarpospora phusangensis TaxID=1070424 RepID=A0A919UN14_9ACTN|nr:hypothetical protein [Acrocarpospora phusangensis]GIH22265.1 hypothetical protein Aph01nite_05750 [Acrocarpospora phusangensis]